MPNLKIILLLLSVSFFTHASPSFKDIDSVVINYSKWTDKQELSYWNIKFTKDELKPFQELLNKAKASDEIKVIWLISSRKGTVFSKTDSYRLQFGREKIARQTFRISLTDQNDKTTHFRLSKADGAKFLKLFNKLALPKIKRKADRVEKHWF